MDHPDILVVIVGWAHMGRQAVKLAADHCHPGTARQDYRTDLWHSRLVG